jgi:hypothetical protein
MVQLGQTYGTAQTVPQSSELAKVSFVAECNFMKIMKAAADEMRSTGEMTDGVENMLQGIADLHEKHAYLLKRRCTQSPMGF